MFVRLLGSVAWKGLGYSSGQGDSILDFRSGAKLSVFAPLAAALVAPLVVLGGCDRKPPRRSPPDLGESSESSPSAVVRALGLDASTLAPVDPPPPAGDLKAEIAQFTTLDACVGEHARIDPLVGDALRALGYDTFLRDACRMLQAMKERKKDACRAIDAQGLRATCEVNVAMLTGDPDACPFELDGEPLRGRDARCVAVASRDARLCAGARRSEAAACEALVLREAKRCGGDAACARDAARWASVLPPPENAGPPTPTRARLVLHGAEGTPEPAQVETDIAAELARGVVVLVDFQGVHAEIGTPHETGATSFAPGPAGRARAALRVVQGETGTKIEHAEIAVPGGAVHVVPGVRFDGAVKIAKLDPKRGGDVDVTMEGTIGVMPRAYKVRLDVTTFVRDVVRAPTAAVHKSAR